MAGKTQVSIERFIGEINARARGTIGITASYGERVQGYGTRLSVEYRIGRYATKLKDGKLEEDDSRKDFFDTEVETLKQRFGTLLEYLGENKSSFPTEDVAKIRFRKKTIEQKLEQMKPALKPASQIHPELRLPSPAAVEASLIADALRYHPDFTAEETEAEVRGEK